MPRLEIVAEPGWRVSVASAPGFLTSLDDFLELCPPERRASLGEILQGFLSLPGASERHDTKNTVALYLENRATGRSVCALQLLTSGAVSVCRGYLVDRPPFEEPDARARFDAQLIESFGDYKRTPKNFYPNVAPAEPAAVLRFAAWLHDLLSAPPS